MWCVPSPEAALLAEGPLPKFLRYVQVHTTSDPAGARVPTTPGQLDLSRMLVAECRAMGLEEVVQDEWGIVTATLPPSPGCGGAPVVGLLAHVDTSPEVSGEGVRPLVHRQYAGGPIALPAGPVVDPAEQPELEAAIGHDIVTSDGSTLLGADDKAGVAEILAAAGRLLRDPDLRHGKVRLAFTTDEETGRGILHLDPERFGAEVAYTLDGGPLGEISWENFEAENLRVVISGRSAHPGTARGRMINAIGLAAGLVAGIPAAWRPETTSGREGFIHCLGLHGEVEAAEVTLIVRDFAEAGMQAKRAWLEAVASQLRAAHPCCDVRIERTGGYRNMRRAVEQRPQSYELALAAMRAVGVEPRPLPIRGGTDGARLSERGLPTPNLFAGGINFHSRTEWISVAWMEKAVDVIVALVQLWGREAGAAGS